MRARDTDKEKSSMSTASLSPSPSLPISFLLSPSLHLSGFCFPSICSMSARVSLSACLHASMWEANDGFNIWPVSGNRSMPCALAVRRVQLTLSLTTLLTSEKQSESIRYTMNGSNVIDESVQRFTAFLWVHCLQSKYWLMDTSSSIFYSPQLLSGLCLLHRLLLLLPLCSRGGESTQMLARF